LFFSAESVASFSKLAATTQQKFFLNHKDRTFLCGKWGKTSFEDSAEQNYISLIQKNLFSSLQKNNTIWTKNPIF